MVQTLTPLQRHFARWQGCQACPLHVGRRRMVFCRGDVPCDVLFVGEGPGKSEDDLGVPFVGPAGKLFDLLVAEAMPRKWVDDATDPQGAIAEVIGGAPFKHTWAFCNLVCCIPLDESGSKTEEPDATCIRACSERLEEFVKIAAPKLIVCVGNLAADWLEPARPLKYGAGKSRPKNHVSIDPAIPRVGVTHPAFFLKNGKMSEAQKGLAQDKVVVTIAQAVEEHVCHAKD